MNKRIKLFATTGLATIVTATAILMATIAAVDRGGTQADMLTLVSISIAICTAAHLLPALSKRRVVWLLWSACLAGTVYGHLTFFTHATIRAGQVRASESATVQVLMEQIDTNRDAISGIRARPITTIARELSWTRSERRRLALEEELSEAKRAARLQDGMVTTAGAISQAKVAAQDDPVVARLVVVTGSSEAGISLAVGLLLSLLVELLGAFLWCEVLSAPPPRPRQHDDRTAAGGGDSNSLPSRAGLVVRTPIHEDLKEPHGPARAGNIRKASEFSIPDLRRAIEAGECRPTVVGIRAFMACSQARALELRRALAG